MNIKVLNRTDGLVLQFTDSTKRRLSEARGVHRASDKAPGLGSGLDDASAGADDDSLLQSLQINVINPHHSSSPFEGSNLHHAPLEGESGSSICRGLQLETKGPREDKG